MEIEITHQMEVEPEVEIHALNETKRASSTKILLAYSANLLLSHTVAKLLGSCKILEGAKEPNYNMDNNKMDQILNMQAASEKMIEKKTSSKPSQWVKHPKIHTREWPFPVRYVKNHLNRRMRCRYT